MYDRFFRLNRNPFAMTPDPNLLFLTDSHREALAGLSYAIMQRKGFVVLEGEAGTGKTTLLRKLLHLLPETEAITSLVLNPVLTPEEFLELLLINFGLRDLPRSKAQRLNRLEQLLWNANEAGKTPVLIIDEAHKLTREVLEEIRLLTNFETDDSKLLQIVLAGQPEIRRILNRGELRQLKQRIAVRLRVEPLRAAEVKEYMQHRWARAGGVTPLPFNDHAISLVASASMGIPRLINSIADNALLLTFSQTSDTVESRFVLDVLADLDLESAASDHLATTNAPLPGVDKAAESASRESASQLRGTIPQHSAGTERSFLGLRWNAKQKEPGKSMDAAVVRLAPVNRPR